MTPFASVALIKRDGETVFRRPRKERSGIQTQARKAAARFWNRASKDDRLLKVIVLRERAGVIEIAERNTGETIWSEFTSSVHDALREPHLAACLAEIGVSAEFVPPPVPDVLIINGHTYRRDI